MFHHDNYNSGQERNSTLTLCHFSKAWQVDQPHKMVRKDCFEQTLTVVTSILTRYISREVYKYIIDKYIRGQGE